MHMIKYDKIQIKSLDRTHHAKKITWIRWPKSNYQNTTKRDEKVSLWIKPGSAVHVTNNQTIISTHTQETWTRPFFGSNDSFNNNFSILINDNSLLNTYIMKQIEIKVLVYSTQLCLNSLYIQSINFTLIDICGVIRNRYSLFSSLSYMHMGINQTVLPTFLGKAPNKFPTRNPILGSSDSQRA